MSVSFHIVEHLTAENCIQPKGMINPLLVAIQLYQNWTKPVIIYKIVVMHPTCKCEIDRQQCKLSAEFRSKLFKVHNYSPLVIAETIPLQRVETMDPNSGFNLTDFLMKVDNSTSKSCVALKFESVKWKCLMMKNAECKFVVVNDMIFERG